MLTFDIEHDDGMYCGRIREYPGIVSQARTPDGLKRKLVRLLREIARDSPDELRFFA